MCVKKIIELTTVILVVVFLFIPRNSFADEVTIISNKSVKVDSLTSREIKAIFVGKKTSWGDNQKIKFVTAPRSGAHEMFLRKYVKKTSSQFSKYWKKQVFTGKAKKPRAYLTEKEILEYVARTKGAIGYISDQATITDDINVIEIKF